MSIPLLCSGEHAADDAATTTTTTRRKGDDGKVCRCTIYTHTPFVCPRQ
jgi:hypothetical protein